MSLRWQACSRAEKCGHTRIGAPVLQVQGAEMDEITLLVVQRAVAGERAAMEQIMRALERPFFNLAQRMLLSLPEAEDAAQECLLRVATRLARFEGGCASRSRGAAVCSTPRSRAGATAGSTARRSSGA